MAVDTDVIDLSDLLARLRRSWTWLIGGAAVGIGLALALSALIGPRYEASSTVVLRAQSPSGLGALSRLGNLSDLISLSSSEFDTEFQILTSRAVLGGVVDQLALHERLEGKVKGSPREAAIDRLVRRVKARRSGGEIAKLIYRDRDPEMAAAVPNAMIQQYLIRRNTTDRSLGQERYEFLLSHSDSLSSELLRAEQAYRQYMENTGAVEPQIRGEAQFVRAMTLRAELETVEMERGALGAFFTQVQGDRVAPRDLVAFPSFLRSPAINDLLSRLLELDVKRGELDQWRTERDPDHQAMTANIRGLEAQLISLSRAYLSGLERQRTELRRELAGYDQLLATLPAQVEESFRRQREVRRLTEVTTALQAQLIAARLAAMDEVGSVRMLDPAVPPSKPAFPNWFLNLFVGASVGLLLGGAGGLTRSYVDPRVRTTRDAGLAAGVSAAPIGRAPALMVARNGEMPALLVIPVGAREGGAGTAARDLAEAASRTGRRTVLVDWRDGQRKRIPAAGKAPALAVVGEGGMRISETPPLLVYHGEEEESNTPDASAALTELEGRHDAVIVALPELDRYPTLTLVNGERPVVLVVSEGVTSRRELSDAAAALRTVGVPLQGVLVDEASGRRPKDIQRG